MPEFLTSDSILQCNHGEAPMPFQTLPLPGKPMVLGGMVIATLTDTVPMLNIPSFVMCNSMANPEVIAATAAAMGELTPMPCVPVVISPWMPPSALTTALGVPLAMASSRCLCAWGGEISVAQPAELIATTQV
jgi:hypothetical protein